MISLMGLSKFCERAGVVDNNNLYTRDIDRIFVSARHEEADHAKKQQNISRFMFFEAWCRIALQRYYNCGSGFFHKVTPECESPVKAV